MRVERSLPPDVYGLPTDASGPLRACKLAEQFLAHAVADRLRLGCCMAVKNALRVLRDAIAEAEGGGQVDFAR